VPSACLDANQVRFWPDGRRLQRRNLVFCKRGGAHDLGTVAEARDRGRKFSKMAKSVLKAKKARRGE